MDPLKFAVVWLKSRFRRGTDSATNPPGEVVRVGANLEPVATSAVNEIVSSVADPLLVAAGFHSTKPRRWIRSFAPIRHIFEIVPMKGASYVPTWGISFDFVPHITGGKLAWHRTEKSARINIVYDPVDFDASWRERACIDSFHGPEGPLSDAQRVLTTAIRQALEWLEPVRDLADALDRAEFLRTADRPGGRFGFANYVQQPLAYAFLLARNGAREDALKALDGWIASHELSELRSTSLSC